jgi:hypothetical protein
MVSLATASPPEAEKSLWGQLHPGFESLPLRHQIQIFADAVRPDIILVDINLPKEERF